MAFVTRRSVFREIQNEIENICVRSRGSAALAQQHRAEAPRNAHFCRRCLTLRVIIYNGNIIIQSSEMALLKKAPAAGLAESEGSAPRSDMKKRAKRSAEEKNGCAPIPRFNCISRYSFRFVTDFIAVQRAFSSQTRLV